MELPTKLGPWERVRPLGRGGMAEVWLARHDHLGVEAALKVVRTAPETFRREVVAMARMNHPGIVQIYDFSMGELPWFAMEACHGPSLRAWMAQPPAWQELSRAFARLLEALAHAHARGVVHLDIKPANVLRFPAGVRLADFGIAWSAEGPVESVSGTAAFMAPEQLSGQWRQFGPGTDLFALGVMIWTLVTGRNPFSESSQAPVFGAARHLPLPGLQPRFPVPEDLEPLLAWMLAKAPSDRCGDAASALVGLRALGPPVGEVTFVQHAELDDSSTMASLLDLAPGLPAAALGRLSEAPPVPPTWQCDWERRRLPPGIDLALLPLREAPLVGRNRERDALWEVLRLSVASGAVQRVVVTGAPGVGRTHLVRWFLHRAHETVGAIALTADHADRAAPLRQALFRTLALEGLAGEALAGQLAHRLPHLSAAQLARCAESLADASTWGQVGCAARLINALARQRPVLLHLPARVFSAVLAELPLLHGPIVVLLTGDEQAVQAMPDPSCSLTLGPLGEKDTVELIQGQLGVERPLASLLARRAAGHPLWAMQLVHHAANQLVTRGGGYTLQGTLALPRSVVEHWLERFDALGLDADALVAFQVAALLGPAVDAELWAESCSNTGVSVPDEGVVERLARGGLVHLLEAGWRFAHPTVAEALTARAEADGRRAGLHACVAAAIRTLGRDAPGLLGEHLVHAGRPAEAVAPLALGVYAATDRADYAEAVRLGRLGLSAGDTTEPTPAHGELWVNLAWAAQYVRADLGEAAEMAGRCFAFTGAGWRPVHYAAEICLANLSSRRGDASGLVLRARRALAIAEEEGNIAFQDRARRLLGQGLAGDPDAAIPVLLSVTKHTPECWIQARMTLAGLARKSGDLEGAAAWLREAEEHINGVGWTVERRMSLHMQLGENARARDDLAEAERCFRMIDQDSHEYFWMPMNVGRLNLAMLAVMDGRSQDAVDLLAHLLDTQPKQRLEFGFATQLLCAAAADLGHWEEVERLWASTSRMFADKPGLLVTQPDCIRLNRLISERARAAGWLALAEEIDALGV